MASLLMQRPSLRKLSGRTKATMIGAVVVLHVVAIGLVLHREPKTIILPPIEVSVNVVAGDAANSPAALVPVLMDPGPAPLPDVVVGPIRS